MNISCIWLLVNCYPILSKATHWYDRIRGLILVEANFGDIISIEKVYSGGVLIHEFSLNN